MIQTAELTNLCVHGGADMVDASESTKHVVDALSFGTVVGTMAGVLPSIAAIFTIVWTAIRIYETQTFRKMFGINPVKLKLKGD
jgi:hypothetical protein